MLPPVLGRRCDILCIIYSSCSPLLCLCSFFIVLPLPRIESDRYPPLIPPRGRMLINFFRDNDDKYIYSGGTHSNIEEKYATAYIKRLQQFLRHCDRVNGSGIYADRRKSSSSRRDHSSSRRRGGGRRRSSSRVTSADRTHRDYAASPGRDGRGGGGTGPPPPSSSSVSVGMTAPRGNNMDDNNRTPAAASSPRTDQTFARKMQQQQQRRQPRRSRSRSQIRRRKKKGTLVMRGGNDDEESEVATDGGGCGAMPALLGKLTLHDKNTRGG